MTPDEMLEVAAHLRRVADIFDQAGRPRIIPNPGPPPLSETDEVRGALLRVPKAARVAPCGCSYYARCQAHDRSRPKGCGCNGPFPSSMCAHATHRQTADVWPSLDVANVG